MMKKTGKYEVSNYSEGEFEPGSRNRVLKNLLSIKRKRQMDALEFKELENTIQYAFDRFSADHSFTINDICDLHKHWLRKIYIWAGSYRSVNMSKDGFHFAVAKNIPKLMDDFEDKYLKIYTPCHKQSAEQTIEAIAIVHVEFILIHPFRDGNGRLGRILASLMAAQNNLPPLDFEYIKGKRRQEYFKAINVGLQRNYEPMMNIFHEIVNRSVRNAMRQ